MGNTFPFNIEEGLYIINSRHMRLHPFIRAWTLLCKACEPHMLLFCKKINVEGSTHSVLTPTFIIEPLKRTGRIYSVRSFAAFYLHHSLFSRDSTSTCLKQREDIVSGGLPGFARGGLPCPGLLSCRCSRRWRGGVFCRFPGRR